MKKIIGEFLVVLVIGTLITFLSACSSGEISENNSYSPSSNELYLDHLGRIPTGAERLSIIRVHNESSEQFSYVNTSLYSLTNKNAEELPLIIDSSSCKILTAGKSCEILANFSSLATGSYRFQVIFSDKNGGRLFSSQLVEIIADANVANQGIELSGYNGAKVVSHNSKYHVNLPVILHKTYESMITSQGKMVCNHGFESGALCNWLIDGMASKENTLLQLSLEGYDKQKQKTAISYQLKVTTSIQANLLLSEIADIEIGTTPENSQTVVIYNSGNYTATAIEPSVSEGLTIIDNQCSDSLSPGRECTFMVQVSGNRNGNGIIDVDYQSKLDGTKSSTSTGVLFIVPASEAVIELTHDAGNIESQIFTGESRVITLDVVNSGSKSISNIRFEATSGTVTSAISDACLLNGSESLAVGAHCLVSIRLIPDREEASMTLSASGSYQDGNGNTFSTIGTYTVSVAVWHNKPITFKSESRPYAAVIFTHIASKGVQSKRVTVTNPNSFAVTMSNPELSNFFDGLSVNATDCTNSPIPAGETCEVVITDSPMPTNVAAMQNLKEDRKFTIRATSPETPEKTVTQNIAIPIRIIRGKVAWVSESALQGNFRALYTNIDDICTRDTRNPVWKDAPAKVVLFGATTNNFEVGLPYINWNYATEFPSRPSNADYYHIPGSTQSPIYPAGTYQADSVTLWNWDGNSESGNDPGHTEDFIWTADTLVNKIHVDGTRPTPTRSYQPWINGRHGICSRPNGQIDGYSGVESSFMYKQDNTTTLWNGCPAMTGTIGGNKSCEEMLMGGGWAWPVLYIGNNAHPSTGSVVAIPENNTNRYTNLYNPTGAPGYTQLYNHVTPAPMIISPGAYWVTFTWGVSWVTSFAGYNMAYDVRYPGSRDLLDDAISDDDPTYKLFPGPKSDYLSIPAPSRTLVAGQPNSYWERNGGSYSRYGAGAGDLLTLTAFAGYYISIFEAGGRGRLNFDSTKYSDTGGVPKETPGTPWGWAGCDTYRHFICVQE